MMYSHDCPVVWRVAQLCGMVFQSGQVLETGVWYSVLAAFVGVVLCGSVGLFVGMVALETRKICGEQCPCARADPRDALKVAERDLTSLHGLEWTPNPLKSSSSGSSSRGVLQGKG